MSWMTGVWGRVSTPDPEWVLSQSRLAVCRALVKGAGSVMALHAASRADCRLSP